MADSNFEPKEYDWRGLSPDELTRARRRWEALVAFFMSKLPPALLQPSVPILNVGCGYGAYQKEWMDKGFRNIEGIEIEEARVAAASAYGVKVQVADYRHLPMFADGQFKIVLVDRVLMQDGRNFAGPEDLSEVFRVCDRTAAILFVFHTTWKPEHLEPLLQLGWDTESGYRGEWPYVLLHRACDTS